MILGMTPLTFFHVLLSLVGIAAGMLVLFGMFASNRLPALTATFLVTTILTSVTGFIFFPFDHLLPSHIVGIISLVALALAVIALYVLKLAGAWRWIYVGTAVFSLYLNVFVLVAQAFQKVPSLHALAPTQAEPPFAIAQGIVLMIFIVFGVVAVRKFHPR